MLHKILLLSLVVSVLVQCQCVNGQGASKAPLPIADAAAPELILEEEPRIEVDPMELVDPIPAMPKLPTALPMIPPKLPELVGEKVKEEVGEKVKEEVSEKIKEKVDEANPTTIVLQQIILKNKLKNLIAGLKRTLKIGDKFVKKATNELKKISNKAAAVIALKQVNIAKQLLGGARIELKDLRKDLLAVEMIEKSDKSDAAKQKVLDKIRDKIKKLSQEIKNDVVVPIKDGVANVTDIKNTLKDTKPIEDLKVDVEKIQDMVLKGKLKDHIKELIKHFGDCKEEEIKGDTDIKDDIEDEEDNIDDIIDEDDEDEVDDIEDEIEDEEEKEKVTDAAGNRSTPTPEEVDDEVDDLEDDVDDIEDEVDDSEEDKEC